MHTKTQISVLAGLLLATAAVSIPEARANKFQDMMQGYFNRNSNNTYSGSAVENANQPAIRNNLETQREALRNSIRDAQQSNRISNSQADELNSELQVISEREANDAATNGFAYAETQSLVNAMSAVDARLQQWISTSAISPGYYNSSNNNNYSGSRNGYGNGNGNGYYRQGNRANADIRNRINSLTNRINRELSDGDISSQEASNLTYRVNAIKQQLPSAYSRRSGTMTDSQIQGRLANIEARLAYDLQNRDQVNNNIDHEERHNRRIHYNQ